MSRFRIIAVLILPMLFILASGMRTAHKFYVSNTIIQENVQSGSLEITIKIFTDDLESALFYQEGRKVKLEMGRDTKHNDAIRTYISQHFKLMDGNNLVYVSSYVGHETELDLTYIYLEIPNWYQQSIFRIENSILFEIYPEQVNIINLKMNTWGQTFNTSYQQRIVDVFK